MRGSLASTAQLSFSLEVDITDAQKVRKEKTSETDGTISMAHVLMRAAGVVLKKLSKLNTILTDEGIHYFDEINIGVAVALKEGLIVPVVKGIDQKSIGEIARTTTDLAEKARDGNLTPDELAGGTFTISVLGSVDSFTPVLNAGQSAIMGVGRSVEKPVVKAGEVVIREMMTISLTVDHQVIDGAVAAEFMRRLKQSIERPAPLFK
jgi:pyruvate dehydrogenase E2 component (dihydrolipoamide acetyltransferase)